VPHTTDLEVQRPRLLDVLTRQVRPLGGRREVVVVSAPAGYGKTTLLAGAARLLRSSGTAVAWVTCAKDDDTSTFWAALLVSLQRALDGSDRAAADALASLVPPRTASMPNGSPSTTAGSTCT
jgi:ATP/maltotriose-dependent transcriptional regulator MalT